MQQSTAETCPSSAGTQHTDNTRTTSVCFGTCSEAEEWHRFQPQAKYKLSLHGVYLAFCLLKKQFWLKLTKAWEKLQNVPWRIGALSEASKVSEGHLGITGQFTEHPLTPLTIHPRRSAVTYMASLPREHLSEQLAALYDNRVRTTAVKCWAPKYFCDSCTSHVPDDRWTAAYFSSHTYWLLDHKPSHLQHTSFLRNFFFLL